MAPEAVTRVSLKKLLPRTPSATRSAWSSPRPHCSTATVRSFVDGDLSHSVPGEPVSSSAIVTPIGNKQLVLSGATTAAR